MWTNLYYVLLIANITPPMPINKGLTHGAIIYAPWDFTVPCVRAADGLCHYYQETVDTGISMSVPGSISMMSPDADGSMSTDYLPIVKGYGPNADLFHKQVPANFGRLGCTTTASINHTSNTRTGDVTFRAGEPMLLLYAKVVTVFMSGFQPYTAVPTRCSAP